MSEKSKKTIQVLDLGDSWKEAIQGRMGSDEVRERIRREHEEARRRMQESEAEPSDQEDLDDSTEG